METTAIFTEHPTFEDIKHNSILFLTRHIRELDKYLAEERSPEDYEVYANIREEQREKLKMIEATTCQKERRGKESERRPSTANSHHTTREQALERRAAQERLLQQAAKLRGQTNHCAEEEKPALEAQIHALLEESRSLYFLAIHPLT